MGRRDLKLRWTRPALADLIEAQDFIAKNNPAAAKIVAQRIWDATMKLRDNPDIGRPGHIGATRELVVNGTPYLVVYRLGDDSLEILRVWHAKRDWQRA